ncbi:hypersensitive-induced response protein [Trifolium repens]|nr:hypersensitive-induced response protein [Trifolium repens]
MFNSAKTYPTTTAPPCLSSIHLRLRTLLPSLSISSNPNRFKAQTPNRQFPNRFHNTHLKSLINFNFPITRRFSLMFLPVAGYFFFLLLSRPALLLYRSSRKRVYGKTVALKINAYKCFVMDLKPGIFQVISCMPWFLAKRIVGHLSRRLKQLDIKCETKTKKNGIAKVVEEELEKVFFWL